MFTWFTLFRFLHILAAIIAFGPSFVFPILGSFGGKEPMHGNFALRVGAAIEDRIVIPFALTMPISGILMIVVSNGAVHWLSFWFLLAVALYLIAMFIAVVVQRGIVHQMIHMTSHMPAPAPAGPGAAPAGPPAEFLALVKRSQMNGMILTVLLVVIVILMIFRPLS
jgi:predicted integral membrane protein DUF2269